MKISSAVVTILICSILLPALARESKDGVVPVDCEVLTLAKLPTPSSDAPYSGIVRLSPSGRPLVLSQNRITSLAENLGEQLFDWAPLADVGGGARGFCWLNNKTLVLLQETQLKILRDGVCTTNMILPFKNMRAVRADEDHFYLFGGENTGAQNDVLLLGVSGSITNLLHVPQPVTAVAGDGLNTFIAVGPAVFFLAGKDKPTPVFFASSAVKELALAPSNGVFYVTEAGLGYMTGPGSGMILLPQKIISMDCRNNRLLVLTADREVLLFSPVAGFSSLVDSAMKALKETK